MYNITFPVDTGRKLNIHKTFNLRLVSTGLSIAEQHEKIFDLDPFRYIAALCEGVEFNTSYCRTSCQAPLKSSSGLFTLIIKHIS